MSKKNYAFKNIAFHSYVINIQSLRDIWVAFSFGDKERRGIFQDFN
jgi:hypothetical protein